MCPVELANEKIKKEQNCLRSLEITTNPKDMVEQFCKSMLQIEIGRSKGLANLVMGLSSQTHAGSVAEVSLSPCYHFQYSSINKVLAELDQRKGKGSGREMNREEVEKNFAPDRRSF